MKRFFDSIEGAVYDQKRMHAYTNLELQSQALYQFGSNRRQKLHHHSNREHLK